MAVHHRRYSQEELAQRGQELYKDWWNVRRNDFQLYSSQAVAPAVYTQVGIDFVAALSPPKSPNSGGL
jgi:hypothetical protein